MTGNKINKLLNLNAKHALYYYKGDWYHHLNKFPGILIDRNGFVSFDSLINYKSSKWLQHGRRLHVRKGISFMPNYQKFTTEQKLLIDRLGDKNIENTIRKLRIIYQIVRNQNLVRKIKKLYKNTCQVCAARIKLKKGNYYSEVHHIKPLGAPAHGLDSLENMICVCPNCHVKLDFYSLELNVNEAKHKIDSSNINFHNTCYLILNRSSVSQKKNRQQN